MPLDLSEANLSKRLLGDIDDVRVISVDNMNDYCDISIKKYRLAKLTEHSTFTFIKGSIADKALITSIFEQYKPQVIVNLAA